MDFNRVKLFDDQLLSHIRSSRNDEAKSLITRDLVKALDDFGTLLHYAAMFGNATITRYLIELGSAIDFLGRGKKTPLMLAVSAGRTAAMKALLNADADIDITDEDGQSALRTALNRDYLNCDIVEPFVRKLQTKIRATEDLAEKLIDSGGNMYHATTLGDVKLLEYLLELGVDVNSKGPNGAAGLHVAAEFNYHHAAVWLIEKGADVNALDKRGNAALHASAKSGSKDVMIILLEHGADFNLTGRRDGCTPIELASKKVNYGENFVECFELFRKHDAKTTMVKFNFNELMYKIKFGHDFTRWQLAENSLAEYDYEGTLLHHAAIHGNATAAKLLIELGSKVDRIVAGRTPLMLAVKHGNTSIVEILLRANANVELTNDEGISALAMALEPNFLVPKNLDQVFIRELLATDRTSEEITRILINAGANMYHAVCSKDIKLMECMLERGIDVNSAGRRGYKTGLHEAAGRNDANLVEWLMEHGADVNAIDKLGESPLFAATTSRETMKILLKRGADPNLENCYGENSLFALFRGNGSQFNQNGLECLELLLQHGAIPQSSELHDSVFDYAVEKLSAEEIRILVSHLTMLDARGFSNTKSFMRGYNSSHRSKILELEAFHEACRRSLETPIFGKLSLCDLLNGSENRLQSLVRNEEFVTEARRVCDLGELNSYYCKRAIDRIDKAIRVVTLKNEAIRVVCKLFGGNYDECYIFAKKVVDYLDVCDLEMLIVIAKTF